MVAGRLAGEEARPVREGEEVAEDRVAEIGGTEFKHDVPKAGWTMIVRDDVDEDGRPRKIWFYVPTDELQRYADGLRDEAGEKDAEVARLERENREMRAVLQGVSDCAPEFVGGEPYTVGPGTFYAARRVLGQDHRGRPADGEENG